MGRLDLLPGEVIFQRGDPSEHAYVIESGQIFGEMGLVDERPRVLTARAVTEARVTTVTRDDLVEMLFRRPEEGLQYLRMLFERLRAMNTRVALAEEAETVSSPGQIEARVTLFPLSEESAKLMPADQVVVKDRGSYLGTIVNGARIGGELSAAQAALHPGENQVALGTADSPFRFRVVVQIRAKDAHTS